jgi:hypothetical protein
VASERTRRSIHRRRDATTPRIMTAVAADLLVARQAIVEEQHLAKLDLGGRTRVSFYLGRNRQGLEDLSDALLERPASGEANAGTKMKGMMGLRMRTSALLRQAMRMPAFTA